MKPDSTTLSTVGQFVIAAIVGYCGLCTIVYKLLSLRYQKRIERLKSQNKTLPLTHEKAPRIYLLYTSLLSLVICVIIATCGYQALYHWLPFPPIPNATSDHLITPNTALSIPSYVSCALETGAVKITMQEGNPICIDGEGMLPLNISNVVKVETNATYAAWTYIGQLHSDAHRTPSTGSYNCPHGYMKYPGRYIMRLTQISLAKTAKNCRALPLSD